MTALPVDRKGLEIGKTANPQSFCDDSVHGWYRIVLGYSDRVVSHILQKFGTSSSHLVLDPFCGAGTTIVECKKAGIQAVGVDANPSSVLAARVKTNWALMPGDLSKAVIIVRELFDQIRLDRDAVEKDPAYLYIVSSGMLQRGWICEGPLREAISLKIAIESCGAHSNVVDALKLALSAEIVGGLSNVKFGPELYCSAPKGVDSPLAGFLRRSERIQEDLASARKVCRSSSRIVLGDARKLKRALGYRHTESFDAIITSPPYPTEHDYTRNARLELVFMGFVENLEHLRAVKKSMLRSHTKGIYAGDDDLAHIKDCPEVMKAAQSIILKTADATSGFEKLYGKVILEYFGGMKRHLQQAFDCLKPGGQAAYVVGDQASYAGVSISTAELLSYLAATVGFEVTDIELWRRRWSTATSRHVDENILLLKKPYQEK